MNNIDNDILCLEKLVTAILFSDSVIGIDDYKDSYRSERLKGFDFVDFLKIDDDVYSRLATDAAEFARGMVFSFDGSKPAGDVTAFFESLRIDPQLRWDVWVSSEYLTLSLLVQDAKDTAYENSIDTIFRNEVVDHNLVAAGTSHQPTLQVAQRTDVADVKGLVQAFAANNQQYAGTDGKSALERMIFGYGWAAERSHFYSAVANLQGADAFLAPLRDAFCESCCRIDYPSQVTALIETLKSKSQQTLVSILEPSGQAKFAVRLPFFTAYLISRTSGPKECIDLALSLRSAAEFVDCRTAFQNLGHLTRSEKTREMNEMLKYLDESCSRLMQKYAVSNRNGLQFSLSLGIAGPSIDLGIKLDQLFRHHKNAPFSKIFRNISQDMLNVERLGELHDKVCSSVIRHKDATYSRVSTTPKYMEHRDSERGRPARL